MPRDLSSMSFFSGSSPRAVSAMAWMRPRRRWRVLQFLKVPPVFTPLAPHINMHYTYALVFRVNLPPLPPHGMLWHNVPPVGCARLRAFHICLCSRIFPHFVKLLANTMQINTTCKDYDSINQHSHQSTPTTASQRQTMTMPVDTGAYIYSNDIWRSRMTARAGCGWQLR